MPLKVETTKKFRKKIDKLEEKNIITEKQVENIFDVIGKLITDKKSLDIKKLVNFNPPTYRIRTQNFRIFYEKKENCYLVTNFDFRPNVYKKYFKFK